MCFVFLYCLFVRVRLGGITAGGAAVFESGFVSNISATGAAHGRKISSAMPAGFLVLADFVTAVIAKKARFFTHWGLGVAGCGLETLLVTVFSAFFSFVFSAAGFTGAFSCLSVT